MVLLHGGCSVTRRKAGTLPMSVVGVSVSEVVPRRVHKGVHGVRLSPG